MGCGVSKVTPVQEEREKSQHINGKPNNHTTTNGHVGSPDNTKSNGHTGSEIKPSGWEVSSLNGDVYPKEDGEGTKPVSQECSERQPGAMSNHFSSPRETSIPLSPSKAVAFDIILGQKDLDRLPLAPKPPRRLKKIESAPTLTREALQQKQAAAEQNRQKELEKKAKVMSKRRSELILAREMDKAQQQRAEIEKKLVASEMKREKTKLEVVAKQKRREEKARRVREMAVQIKEGSDVVNIAVDHDETYNADEEDESWDINNSVTPSSSGNLDNNNNTDITQQSSQVGTNHQNSILEQEANTVHDFFDL